MPVVADVEPVALVALIAGAVVIVVIAVSLVAVTRILGRLAARLETIAGSMAAPPPGEEPSEEDVLEKLKRDLEAGQALLESERERRAGG